MMGGFGRQTGGTIYLSYMPNDHQITKPKRRMGMLTTAVLITIFVIVIIVRNRILVDE